MPKYAAMAFVVVCIIILLVPAGILYGFLGWAPLRLTPVADSPVPALPWTLTTKLPTPDTPTYEMVRVQGPSGAVPQFE